MSQRADRVGHLIQQELVEILRSLKNPRLDKATLITVTHVRVSDDLGVAWVTVSIIDEKPQEVLKVIGRAQKYVQGQLLRRLSAKKIPELRFALDDTEVRAGHIDELLKAVRSEPPVGESSDPGRPAPPAAIVGRDEPDDE